VFLKNKPHSALVLLVTLKSQKTILTGHTPVSLLPVNNAVSIKRKKKGKSGIAATTKCSTKK
jgi:hypothetical protein